MLDNNETSNPASNWDCVTDEALRHPSKKRIVDLTGAVFDIVQGVLIRDTTSVAIDSHLRAIAALNFDRLVKRRRYSKLT